MVFSIVYFSPYYNREVHLRIIELLKAIELRHGIPWREVVVDQTEWYRRVPEVNAREVYENYLKPASRRIKECLEVLRSLGVDVVVETAAKKFKTRSGFILVAGTLTVMYGDNVVCALKYDKEIIQFLEMLLREGSKLLSKLPTTGLSLFRSKRQVVPEREFLMRFARSLQSEGFEVYVNVKHNFMSGENPQYLFQPDADIIAIKGRTVVGFEVKSAGREGTSLDKVYTGIGEAFFYLINPVVFIYNRRRYDGGIFDKVYLVLPSLPEDFKDVVINLVRSLRAIGLITFNEGVIVDPNVNPFLNIEKKEILLRNREVIFRYRLT